MPRIPTVNAEKTLSVGNQPTMPAGFGTAPGQAMQKLGSAIGSFGAALEAGAEQEDPATELQNQIAIANHEAAKQRSFMELQNTHVVGSDPTERVTQWNNQWAERDNQAYGALRPTTTRNANRYKLHQVESHNRTLINSDQWKYKAREEYVGGQVSKLVNDSVKDLVGQGPEAIKQNIPGLMDQVDKVISNPSISPRMRERLRGEAATLIYQSTLDGLPEAERLPFIEGKIKEWSALSKEREAANPGGGASGNNGEDVESDGSPKLLKGPTSANQNDKEPYGKTAFKFFESKVPSPGERRAIQAKGGIVVNLDTNWSKGNPTGPMIVIPDNASPAQREAAQAYVGELYKLNKEVFGRSLPPRVVTRSENGRGRAATIHTEPYAVTDAAAVKFFSTPEGQAKHAAILRNTLGKIPGVHFSIPHDPSKGDMGASGNGTNEVTLAKGVIAALQGGNDGTLTSGGEAGTSQSTQSRGVPTIRDAVAEIAIKDRSRLLARHQKFLEEQAQMQQVFRMVKGEVAFDKYDTDQKKMVDTWAEKTGLGQKLLSGDLRVVGAIVESTKALNHLPTPFSSTLRTMAKSKDPKAQGTAYEVAASILTNNPNALDGDGLKDLREEAEAYREMLTGPSKMTTEEAIGRIQEAKSDEWRKKVDARKEDAKKHSDAIDAGDTLAVFAGFMQRNFGSGGELNPQRADLILGEYRERFREHFTRWGDKDLATRLAGNDMKRVYGMSSATGVARVMRYPPERSFPPIGKDGHKYIQDDIKVAVQGYLHDVAKRADPKAGAAPEVDMKNIDLIYVENRTAQQIAAGNMPRYRVIYKDPKTGIPMVLPYNWTLDKSDIEAAKKSAEKGFNEAREKAAKQAEDMKPTKESRKAMEAYKPDKLLADGVKAVLGAISPDGEQKDAARRQLEERMKGSEELNNRALSERDSRRENARKSGTIPDSFRQLSGGGSE